MRRICWVVLSMCLCIGCASALHPYRTARKDCYTFEAGEEIQDEAFYLWISDLWDSPVRLEAGTQWEMRFGPNWEKQSGLYAYINEDYRLAAQIPRWYYGRRVAIKSHDGKKFYSASGEIRMPQKNGQPQDLKFSELDNIAPIVGDETFLLVNPETDPGIYRRVSSYFDMLHLKLRAYNILTPGQIRAILRMDTYEESRYLNIISNLSIIPGIYHPSIWAEPGFRFFRVIAELNYAKQNFIVHIDNSVYADSITSRYDVEWMMARRDILKEQMEKERTEVRNLLTEIYLQGGESL